MPTLLGCAWPLVGKAYRESLPLGIRRLLRQASGKDKEQLETPLTAAPALHPTPQLEAYRRTAGRCDDVSMTKRANEAHYPVPSDDDIARATRLLNRIGGPNVSWGAIDIFEVLTGEHRLAVERSASQRLMRATWVLAAATVVLAIATIALIFATLAG